MKPVDIKIENGQLISKFYQIWMKSYLGAKSISVFVYDSSFLKCVPSCKITWINQEYCHGAYFETDLIAIKFIGFAQKESYLTTLLVDETTASALGLLSLTNNTQTLHMILG